MSSLIKYDAMCQAIAECHRVDEVKDLRDKAMALELYAKQARNTDAERKASEVRLRAERRTGELLKELTRAEAGATRNPDGRRGKEPMSDDGTQVLSAVTRQPEPSPYAKALADTGMSRQTAHRYQALANVPDHQFEEALRNPEVKPTTSRLIQQVPKPADAVRMLQGGTQDSAMVAWSKVDKGNALTSVFVL